jgi:tetratricopeptide (TPR) repeat protein
MSMRVLQRPFVILVLLCGALLPGKLLAQKPSPNTGMGSPGLLSAPGVSGIVQPTDVEIYIQGPNGTPVEGVAVVSLVKLNGQLYRQGTAKAGHVRFNDVAPTEYAIQVVAPGFGKVVKQIDAQSKTEMKVTIRLQEAAEGEDAGAEARIASLAPKAQKELGKALEALRAKKPAEARSHLDMVQRSAPNHPEVNYFFGVYSSQLNDWEQAKSYWTKTIEIYPKHILALLSLSEALLRENKAGEALPYLNRGIESEPSSWRAHAILAEVLLRLGDAEEALKQAERAIELGHGQAGVARRVQAAALAKRDEKDRAVAVLQSYLADHPTDVEARKQLENLQAPAARSEGEYVKPASAEAGSTVTTGVATAVPLPSGWLPPDLDEKVPPVVPGAACSLDEVLEKSGERIREFVGNVDRFTATELVEHKSVNKWGIASTPEMRKFNYLVSIQEPRAGYFNVEEYRASTGAGEGFPEGVQTNGLPAMVLIFHPYNAGDFEMSCEGLARWNGSLAWQVHFRQRSDRPNRMRTYKLGADGPSYAVALKGRAWIAADSFQIVRLETGMIAPLPQIRLAADYTVIEYGAVHFSARKLDMWLPQSAQVYFDWKGRRMHRRHSFSKYLLFSVDDKQSISGPKVTQETPPKALADQTKQN